MNDDMLDSLRYATWTGDHWEDTPEDYDEPVWIGPAAGVKRFAILGQTIFNTYGPDGSLQGHIQYEIRDESSR